MAGITPALGERQLANLQKVTDAALAHLSLDDLLEELLARIVEIIGADTAAILLLDERQEELVTRAARGLEESVERGTRIPLGGGFAGRVAAERRAIAVEDIDKIEIVNPLLRERGLRSLLGVPLIVESNLLGVLHVGTFARRVFSQDDAAMLQLVADRSAVAIEHARLYEREHAIAETLQRSLLPERIPDVPGVTVAVRYLPARTEADVGGDWYDMISLKHGTVGLAIGDVAGDGVPAASLMGQLRAALRAYALEGHPPATAMQRLNHLTHRVMPGRMATAVYIVLDLQSLAFSFANAGHLPPLVVEPDGSARFLGEASAEPLGALGHASYTSNDDVLRNGATLVLCTDGLVERRSEGLDEGLERLRSLAVSGPSEPSALCDHIIRGALGSAAGEDDVALVVLRADPVATDAMRLSMAADPDELVHLRRTLGRWLHVVGATPEEVYDITVACTEASANAVEHAYSPEDATFEVEAAARDDTVAVTVRDAGSWRAPRGVHRGRGLQIMRALMDEVDVTSSEGGTTVELRRRLSAKDSS